MSSASISWKEIFSFRSLSFTFLGVLCAVISIKGFMIPNHFLDGGITGISILIHEIYHIDVSIPLILLNLPFIYLGYRHIGKDFAISALIALILLAIFLNIIPVPAITHDSFLTAAFGGFFIGLGIGFVIRGGGVLDGLEVVADYTNKKYGLTTSEIIIGINTTIFIIIAFQLGLDKAMYSIITYFTAIKVSDYVVDGFEEYTALTIISPESEKIKSLIVNELNKAISVYKGERGHLPGNFDVKHDCDIIVTIVTRLEIHKIKQAIYKTDPNAFMYIQSIKEVKGGQLSKKRKH